MESIKNFTRAWSLRAPSSPKELEAALLRLPIHRPWILEPEALVLLAALYRHLPRQRWVGRVVRERLDGDLSHIGQLGSLAHPKAWEQEGRVPGLAGWTYCFHGRGCCLTSEEGVEIDVDFVEGGCETIDPWFYASYLRSVSRPDLLESRLRRAPPLEEFWLEDLEQLRELGWLQGRHGVAFTEAGLEAAGLFDALFREIEGAQSFERPVYFAALLGDWALAARLCAADGVVGGRCLERARPVAQRRAERLSWKLSWAQDAFEASRCLLALAETGWEFAEAVLERILARRPVDGAVSRALGLLAVEARASKFLPSLVALLTGSVGEQAPEPHVRVTACRLLMEVHGPDRLPRELSGALLAALRRPSRGSEAESGLLLWLIEPAEGLRRLESALIDSAPISRMEAFAALELVGSRAAKEALGRHGVPAPPEWVRRQFFERFSAIRSQWLFGTNPQN